MEKDECKNLVRNLINKIYNVTTLSDELLDEVKNDIELMNEFISKKAPYRELVVLIDSAKRQTNLTIRQSYKYVILGNLEKRYKRLDGKESEIEQIAQFA